jgi:hypothetical protein
MKSFVPVAALIHTADDVCPEGYTEVEVVPPKIWRCYGIKAGGIVLAAFAPIGCFVQAELELHLHGFTFNPDAHTQDLVKASIRRARDGALLYQCYLNSINIWGQPELAFA